MMGQRAMAVRNANAPRRWRTRRIVGATLMALACLLILSQLWFFFRIVYYAYQPPGQTAVMRQALSQLREKNEDAVLAYDWVSYDQINASLKRAVIAAEDANFVSHSGVEWEAIRKAWEYNQAQAEAGRARMRGGSTISQQLAKNLFLSGSRTYVRKGQELVLTYMIEHVMSKERILTLYLNVAEWGVGVFGAQAAARHYFKTDAAKLTNAQAARLAAMLPNPRFYDTNRNTRYLNSRTSTLQARMRGAEIP